MAALSEDRGAISTINVTPFVDVVLVLLIILMVTSTQIVRASIGVDLPRAASGGEAVDRTLNIVVGADGKLSLDGAALDEAQLAAAVKAAVGANPEVRAVVSADRDAAYHAVIRALDVAKSSGLSKFALDVERAGVSP